MMASPSVLLPDPLGPISACVSPWRIVRFTPRKIGFSSTETCKFLIVKTCDISNQYSLKKVIQKLTGDFLMIEDWCNLRRRGNPTAVMRNRQLVLRLFSKRQVARKHPESIIRCFLGNLVTANLVLNPHQAFQ